MKTLYIPYEDQLGVRAKIGCTPWSDVFPYLPYTSVRVSVFNETLRVSFISDETPLLLTAQKYNDPVYRDSCVECFLMPFPEADRRYLNFELNAAGVLFLGIGTHRYDRIPLPEYKPEDFSVSSNAAKTLPWTVSFELPFDIIEQIYGLRPQRGSHMKGNFYKCGNRGVLNHYAVWNPVAVPKPDFHRPEYFGRLIIAG